MTHGYMTQNTDISSVIFDPPLISTAVVNSINDAKQNPQSLSLGIPALNEFIMARKSKVVGILGDTSNGKTSLMTEIARNMAGQIDASAGEIGLYITWEDNIEDFGLADFANFSKIPLASLYSGEVKDSDFARLMKASVTRAATPLWLAGHSETSATRPMLTMTDVWAVCDNLVNKQQRKIKFIMADYLQRVNRADMRGEGETRMQYSGVMDSLKNLALSYSTCVFVGSQVARSKVEALKWRQPQIHWAMETSNFEHSCDGALSVWMPYKSKDVYKIGDSLIEKQGVHGVEIHVTENLMLIEILKQKKAKAPILKALDFIPQYNMFVPYGTAQKHIKEIQEQENER